MNVKSSSESSLTVTPFTSGLIDSSLKSDQLFVIQHVLYDSS